MEFEINQLAQDSQNGNIKHTRPINRKLRIHRIDFQIAKLYLYKENNVFMTDKEIFLLG